MNYENGQGVFHSPNENAIEHTSFPSAQLSALLKKEIYEHGLQNKPNNIIILDDDDIYSVMVINREKDKTRQN